MIWFLHSIKSLCCSLLGVYIYCLFVVPTVTYLLPFECYMLNCFILNVSCANLAVCMATIHDKLLLLLLLQLFVVSILGKFRWHGGTVF